MISTNASGNLKPDLTTKFLIEERLVKTFIDGDLAFKSPKAPRTEFRIILANFN